MESLRNIVEINHRHSFSTETMERFGEKISKPVNVIRSKINNQRVKHIRICKAKMKELGIEADS